MSSDGRPLPPIVTAEWLAGAANGDVAICDVRYYLDGSDGHSAYRGGHIPGALFVDMDSVLAGPPGPGVGRHPLPSPEAFAAGLGHLGIGDDTPVVAYDDRTGGTAARLVWMLRVLGKPAAVLSGGLAAWSALDGAEVESGDVTATPVERSVLSWPADAFADSDDVAAAVAAEGVVVDSRAGERYRGESEPIDPKAGHVPGAVNLPFAENVDETGAYRPADELRARFDSAGVDEHAVIYCGSGVTACHNLLAIEAAGLGRARLYVGSWSGWSSEMDRPVAVGGTD